MGERPSTAGSPRLRAAAGLAAGVVLLAACSGTPGTGPSSAPGDFSGPWAEELAYYDSVTDSEFAHRAFADSEISDAEVQEGMRQVLACYDDHGATVEYDAYGLETVDVLTGSEDPLDVMGLCAFADGGVVALHDQIRLNPDNLDAFTIQAACMVEHGIVEPGFTARDLENTYEEGAATPWEPADQETATACQLDPLGLASDAGTTGSTGPSGSATP
ncbi:hypothetical protein [Cellulomonas sp. ES6]|uniref:hypothetical protein n=1 Tax=Cellulomonas sp. ES6 TaxID=3039384 RepID=UPI0024B73486|nr:hypothetical protein [Cellulomonas sp. ES6]WHP18121.1 hypothetical protein P9841_02825 [Cellulomonas sp. ES6]